MFWLDALIYIYVVIRGIYFLYFQATTPFESVVVLLLLAIFIFVADLKYKLLYNKEKK